MLSDLLDLSRADNHQLSVRRDAFSLLPSLEHALRLARAAHRNPIHDDLAAVPNLADLEVVGDPDRLVQCIGNLIGNAAKYSPSDQPVALEVNHQGTAVEISVIDQGPGIPADQLERIFERFTRAEGVALPKGESSSGLGLSIVTMLMQAMGGSVSVSSTVGQGSRFSLRLPVADQP
jgi:signal transduction histidine kinase